MSRAQQVIWAVVVVVIVGAVYLWVTSSQQQSTSSAAATSQPIATNTNAAPNQPAPTPTTANTSAAGAPTNAAPTSATVIFDGSGFSPSNVTVAQGGTVTFTSQGGEMWVASDPHPIHNGYDGTTLQQHCASGYAGPAPFDECAPGTSFTFTFNKVGTWGYHDHLDHSAMGTVTVVAQ